MTGLDLIVYILQNNLENEEVFKDGRFLMLLTKKEVAMKYGVGTSTVHAMLKMGKLKGVEINGETYIFPEGIRGDYEKSSN